jgi:tyrosine-specific transport protein
VFALIYPRGFVIALGYAAIFVAILEILLPSSMIYKLRKNNAQKSIYKSFWGHPTLLALIFIAGIAVILCQILVAVHVIT